MSTPIPDTTIKIKNYRCFSDTIPVSVTIGKGFTALVGPNNSGKSSVLRLFYELRDTLQMVGPNGNFLAVLRGEKADLGNPLGVLDPHEIFCDSNPRPLSIEFKVSCGPVQTVSPLLTLARLTRTRENRLWMGEFETTQSLNLKGVSGLGFAEGILNIPGRGSVDCSALFRSIRSLSTALYVGPFRNALNEGAASYYDLAIGTSFISTWNSWKTGYSKANNLAAAQVTEDIKRIFGFKKLEINAAEGMKTLHVLVEGKPYKLGELGAGMTQFIVVFVNAAISKPSFILIDEPELNLHPSLQVDFLTSLGSYARDGVIFATHSIGLARATADRLFSLQRMDDAVVCRPFEQTPNYAEFVGEMSFSSFRELGFERILLVEGVTDVRTMQQFLRMFDKDHKVVIIPLGGDQLAKGGMELELAELMRITPKIAALVDSEREGDGQPPSKKREEFAASCIKLGIEVCLTKLRATENYFSDQAIKAEMGDNYKALGPYEVLKKCTLPWAKHENWRIARKMLKGEIEPTDVGQFLKSL